MIQASPSLQITQYKFMKYWTQTFFNVLHNFPIRNNLLSGAGQRWDFADVSILRLLLLQPLVSQLSSNGASKQSSKCE